MDENMEQRLLHHVPTELAIDRSTLPPPSEDGEGGPRVAIHRKFQDTTRKVPHVRLPRDAFVLSRAKEFRCRSLQSIDRNFPCQTLKIRNVSLVVMGS
jgi:hypothetical protein